MKRKKITVNGRVQGVGFRPFVYRLAREHSLNGSVSNNEQGVIIDVQGQSQDIDSFESDLMAKHPPLAQITEFSETELKDLGQIEDFVITPSTSGKKHSVLISPDASICPDCAREIFDPQDRRYLYPFTNCTNCGPRLTITRSIPYDRPMTSMSCFGMCPDCLREYNDPMDRRFHAQPNACPVCGPQVWLTDNTNQKLAETNEALLQAAKMLVQGRVIAAKGLGGFHLVCHAQNNQAIETLRQRKHRPGKSLAVMVQDMNTAEKIASINKSQKDILTGMEHPIVILPVKKPFPLSPFLSPDTDNLGLMLPYTPFHMVLFHFLKELGPQGMLPALVMTSGNFSSEPISLGNREAFTRLNSIADYFLFHNRDILVRCDDSVVFAEQRSPVFLRRARGYVPSPVFLAQKGPCVLGVGPELKNTICLTKENQAYVSQHIGDLKNLETYEFFQEIINHFQDVLRVEPRAIVRDFHPDYLSSGYAEKSGLPVYQVQHHFAHIFSVMAENKFEGPCLGVAIDGTGLGLDKTLWGGELLIVDNTDLTMRRLGSFHPVSLPGGEKAIEEPWRIAVSFLQKLNISKDKYPGSLKVMEPKLDIVNQMLNKNINSPLSSGCGRLFDAVSALLGLVEKIDYEGQAAIRLEKIQDRSTKNFYDLHIHENDNFLTLDTVSLFEKIYIDYMAGMSPEIISRKFHLALSHGICRWVLQASQKTGIKTVGLSGGVMQNMTVFRILSRLLAENGLNILVHKQLPPNDACVSLGQAAYGRKLLQSG
ncbi:MAG: carbamoyltransferase HypF [Desulfonatronovibrio sp. MSAO_Bac4]|nr:MAG: carbamoyltransferase HypF [Desulfonatronovibrio sp. MSAO_Bac4]